MTKKKVSKKVEPKIVDQKGDEVIVDESGNLVIEEAVDIFDGVELEEDETTQELDHPAVAAEAPSDVVSERNKKLVGHHPITKEPVYK